MGLAARSKRAASQEEEHPVEPRNPALLGFLANLTPPSGLTPRAAYKSDRVPCGRQICLEVEVDYRRGVSDAAAAALPLKRRV